MLTARRLTVTVALASTLAACGTSYDLSTAGSIDDLDDVLSEATVEHETVTVFDPDQQDGDIVSIEGLPDGTTLESVPDGTTGLVVTAVDNTEYEMPDIVGMQVDEARDVLEDLLGDLTPRMNNVADVWNPDVAVGEVAEVEVDGDSVDVGELVPTDESVSLLIGEARDLSGEYLLNAEPEDLVAREGETTDGGTNSNWETRGPVGWEGSYCAGRRGYGDIREGFNLTLRDAGGTVVSTASLSEGEGVYDGDPDATSTLGVDWDCLFTFTFRDVPASDFYEITSNRGTLTYDFADVHRGGTVFSLTLGND